MVKRKPSIWNFGDLSINNWKVDGESGDKFRLEFPCKDYKINNCLIDKNLGFNTYRLVKFFRKKSENVSADWNLRKRKNMIDRVQVQM